MEPEPPVMTERRRALLISPEFPYPLRSGGTQRTFHVLNALTERHQLDLLTFSEHPRSEDQKALQELCEQVHIIDLPQHAKSPTAFVRRNLSRAVRGVNPLVDRFNDPPLRQKVDAWLHNHHYDLIVVEHSWIAQYIRQIKSSPNRDAFTVLDAHNVESDLWNQYYHWPAKWWHKPALFRYWRGIRDNEKRYLNLFDLVLAVSRPDANQIALQAPGATVSLVPNGVELPSDGISLDSRHRLPIVGFVGSVEYPPNELGLQWFLSTVWPKIKERVNQAQLLIIGQGEARKLTDRCRGDDTIRLTGHVDQLAPYLNRMAVMIAPLWHGSGTRIKILEAWAHGITVVSTSKGAEGLEVKQMENIWIADTAADFATAVVYLLTDHATRQRLCRAAWRDVQKYAWPVIEEELQTLLGNFQTVQHLS